MLAIQQNNDKNVTKWIFVIFTAIWLNFAILPFAHANEVEQLSNHSFPHCPTPEKDSCQNNNNCENCDCGLNILKAQIYNYEQEDHFKFALIPSVCAIKLKNESQLSKIHATRSEFNNIFPLYLKNCSFLN